MTSVEPWTVAELPSPKPLRVRIRPSSFSHSTAPFMSSAYSPRDPMNAKMRLPSVSAEPLANVPSL